MYVTVLVYTNVERDWYRQFLF